MPTYEYECTNCGHEFERFQSMTEPPVKRCPECRHKVKKLLSGGAGIIFKGSGFYETDYRSSAYKKQAKEESRKAKEATTDSPKKTSEKKKKAPEKKS